MCQWLQSITPSPGLFLLIKKHASSHLAKKFTICFFLITFSFIVLLFWNRYPSISTYILKKVVHLKTVMAVGQDKAQKELHDLFRYNLSTTNSIYYILGGQ